VVPQSLWWELLRFLVAEDVGEHFIWVRDSLVHFGLSDDHLPPFDSGGKYCFVYVVCSQYDG